MLINLNTEMGEFVQPHGYELDPTKKYEIIHSNEIESQIAIIQAVNRYGLPALRDYNDWLENNNIVYDKTPVISNEFVSQFYGKKPLWKTELSQGIVMKDFIDGDYYIIMECSRLNEGFKYTKIMLTLGGCYD
jgi:hypothetical protein